MFKTPKEIEEGRVDGDDACLIVILALGMYACELDAYDTEGMEFTAALQHRFWVARKITPELFQCLTFAEYNVLYDALACYDVTGYDEECERLRVQLVTTCKWSDLSPRAEEYIWLLYAW